MKFSILQEKLLAALKLATRASKKKTDLPCLKHVLLTADKTVKLFTTDIEFSVWVDTGGIVDQPGQVGVNVYDLLEVVQMLPAERLDIELLATELHVTCIKSGYETFVFPTLPIDEFIAVRPWEGTPNATIPDLDFQDMVNSVAFAASKEDNRPVLTGVYTTFEDNQIHMVASNGFRLSTYTLPDTPTQNTNRWTQRGLIIPARPLTEMAKLVRKTAQRRDVELSTDGNVVWLSYTTTVKRTFTLPVVMRQVLIQGNYPNWPRAVLQKPDHHTTVNRLELLEYAKDAHVKNEFTWLRLRLSKQSPDMTYALSMNNIVEVYDQRGYRGQLHANIKEHNIVLGAASICVQTGYLIDALQALDSEYVVIENAKSDSAFSAYGYNIQPVSDEPRQLHFIMPFVPF